MVEKLGLHLWGPPSWVSGNATPQPRRCTASEGRVALRLLEEVLLEKRGGQEAIVCLALHIQQYG